MDNGEAAQSWPLNTPRYHNASTEPCDAWVGHCQCGAFHSAGEFQMVDRVLYRNGKPVVTELPMPAQLAPGFSPSFPKKTHICLSLNIISAGQKSEIITEARALAAKIGVAVAFHKNNYRHCIYPDGSVEKYAIVTRVGICAEKDDEENEKKMKMKVEIDDSLVREVFALAPEVFGDYEAAVSTALRLLIRLPKYGTSNNDGMYVLALDTPDIDGNQKIERIAIKDYIDNGTLRRETAKGNEDKSSAGGVGDKVN